MVVPFDNGDEAMISLDYDKLCNYCTFCHLLSHVRENCPELMVASQSSGDNLKETTDLLPKEDGQWEVQKKKSGKRSFTGSGPDISETRTSKGHYPATGQVFKHNNGGGTSREQGGPCNISAKVLDSQEKSKFKRPSPSKEGGVSRPRYHNMGRGKSASWSKSLYPSRGSSANNMVAGDLGTKTIEEAGILDYDQVQSWADDGAGLDTDDYGLESEDLHGLDGAHLATEEGKIILGAGASDFASLNHCLPEKTSMDPRAGSHGFSQEGHGQRLTKPSREGEAPEATE